MKPLSGTCCNDGLDDLRLVCCDATRMDVSQNKSRWSHPRRVATVKQSDVNRHPRYITSSNLRGKCNQGSLVRAKVTVRSLLSPSETHHGLLSACCHLRWRARRGAGGGHGTALVPSTFRRFDRCPAAVSRCVVGIQMCGPRRKLDCSMYAHHGAASTGPTSYCSGVQHGATPLQDRSCGR